ncbi:putative toxin-antitoxin system toxin component, PIN family [Candidatus Leptofilum sp.]|uniref:putative toxin-antitoxin system toxin component, PIN family n=1 Tax=Candidatus Leptofilum sp. TaxID=3241576 RepID=UPI003B5B04A2
MRIVLDANIYISALITSRGNPTTIIQKWLIGEFDVLLSQPIVDEVLRVTAYERLQKKYRKIRENRLEFVELISEQGIWTEPLEKLAIVTADESDNRYLECAVAGGAAYIVSGDNHLLNIGSYRGINILTPAAFLALLEMEGG